jgi:hypothetical protein
MRAIHVEPEAPRQATVATSEPMVSGHVYGALLQAYDRECVEREESGRRESTSLASLNHARLLLVRSRRAFLTASAFWFASMALAVIGWGWLAVEKGWIR